MKSNLDILFLGGLFPKERENEIINNSKGIVQNAANNLQWEIVQGLDANLNNPVKILNSLYIGSFPFGYKKLLIDTYNFSHTKKSEYKDINVGFINLFGFNKVHKYMSLKPYIKKWATESKGTRKVVIAYAMTFTFTSLLKYIKLLNPNILTCLIVPDLPQYMNVSKMSNLFYKKIKYIELKMINENMEFIDSYVLLTEHMKNVLNISVPYVVVEGISTDLFETIDSIPESNDKKVLLYSGSLSKKYGIIELVTSFRKLNDSNYRLVICGEGEAKDFILSESQRDNRISYKGILKREEVLKLQKKATLLINPRANNDEYTKYSFPSKIIEYMSSGTPVLSYKLDGIPDEYFRYMYVINEEENGLYEALKSVLSKTEKELKEKGLSAKDFVLTKKNRNSQTKKIINMLESL